MILRNANVFCDDNTFHKGEVQIKDGKIISVLNIMEPNDSENIDLQGMYLCPGFIDIHTHGSNGYDFCDENEEKFQKIMSYLASQGVTSFLGTTMSFSEETLHKILVSAVPYWNNNQYGSILRGINVEGPFFNVAKKGAQNGKFIKNPDREMFQRLYDASKGMIKIVDIAPEVSGSMDFIEEISQKCRVSLAHTNTNYETAIEAFERGATNVTHLFNAMPPLNHRDPSLVGAAFEKADFVEVICDGIHLHPTIIKIIFHIFSEDRVCLISDSMRACGLKDGDYTLGGQTVTVEGSKATLQDGTIAGSVTCLSKCFRNAVEFGIPLEKALVSATITPAKAAGLQNITGSITVGKDADLVVLDQLLYPQKVMIQGKIIELEK